MTHKVHVKIYFTNVKYLFVSGTNNGDIGEYGTKRLYGRLSKKRAKNVIEKEIGKSILIVDYTITCKTYSMNVEEFIENADIEGE